MKALVHAVRDINHRDVVCMGTLTDESHDSGPREWSKLSYKTREDVKVLYMAKVIAESPFFKQERSSCWLSTCLLLWQRKEVR